jgi:hypothetical protein
MKKFAHYSIEIGRFNLASNEKDACLRLYTSGGNFSQTFPLDEQPEIDGLLPSKVMDLIEARLDSYWISTGREEDKKRIARWRIEQSDFDAAWLKAQIEHTEKLLKVLRNQLDDIEQEEGEQQ